jgi:hypothetical protein
MKRLVPALERPSAGGIFSTMPDIRRMFPAAAAAS